MGTIDIGQNSQYKYINNLDNNVNVYQTGQTFIFRGPTSVVDFSNESNLSDAFVSDKPITYH